jgi:hypothetical protein
MAPRRRRLIQLGGPPVMIAACEREHLAAALEQVESWLWRYEACCCEVLSFQCREEEPDAHRRESRKLGSEGPCRVVDSPGIRRPRCGDRRHSSKRRRSPASASPFLSAMAVPPG